MKILLLLALVCGISCSTISKPEWTRSNNALSAKLVFEIDNSGSAANVIHPKIILRNDSDKPTKFLKDVANAGVFNVRNADGTELPMNFGSTRSGPLGAEVVEIRSGETMELDAYDYGYGIPPNTGIYTFNTSSFQSNLKPGDYLVDYSLDLDKAKLKRILKSYNWITNDPETLWTGQIIIRDVKMSLK